MVVVQVDDYLIVEQDIDWRTIISDPKIKAAMQDVDQSLLDWSLSLSPLERLRSSYNAAYALREFKHVKT
jgi:hypothetical protein